MTDKPAPASPLRPPLRLPPNARDVTAEKIGTGDATAPQPTRPSRRWPPNFIEVTAERVGTIFGLVGAGGAPRLRDIKDKPDREASGD
jgi:hypothetical protein